MRAYQKVGFQVEGTLREEMFVNGRWHDLIYMGLLEREFAAAEAAAEAAAGLPAPARPETPPEPVRRQPGSVKGGQRRSKSCPATSGGRRGFSSQDRLRGRWVLKSLIFSSIAPARLR